jgi:Lysyl oxidase
LACLALAIVVAPSGARGASAAAASRLPDLTMAPIDNVFIDTLSIPGHRLLRYRTKLVNVGAGPFELEGSRPDQSAPTMSVEQRIYDSAGGFTDMPTAAHMKFEVGDGHTHWHTIDLLSGELETLGSTTVAASAKHGFCFADNGSFDLSLPGAPSAPVYISCGGPNDLNVTMGLSVGWADTYGADLLFQWIDVTDVPAGTYRLVETADASHWFAESDESNNTTALTVTIPPSTTGPVTLATPAPGSSSTNPLPTFSGTASGGSPRVDVKIYAGSAASGTPVQTLSTTRTSDGSFSVTASSPLDPGTYTAQAEQPTVYARDAFGRTVPPGQSWGTADVGGPWSARFTLTGNAYSVGGGSAKIAKAAIGTYGQVVGVTSQPDVSTAVRVSWDRPSSGAGSLVPLTLISRFANSQNYYQGRLVQTVPGALQLQLVKTVAGVNTSLAGPKQIAPSYTPGTVWWVRFETAGAILRMRAWPDGTAEPTTWTVSAVDTTFPDPGAVGIQAQSFAGSTAAPLISYDDFVSTGSVGVSPPDTFTIAPSAAPIASDSFTRSITGGVSWGAADVGGTWSARFTTTGNAYSVDGTAAKIARQGTATYAQVLPNAVRADVDEAVDVSWSDPASGATLVPLALVARFGNSLNFYQGRLTQTVSGAIQVQIVKTAGGVNMTIAGPTEIAPGGTGLGSWRVRFQAIGSTLRIRAWPTGTTEPPGWAATGTDPTPLPAGGVGIGTLAFAGATAAPMVSYDNFTAFAAGTG